MHGLYNKITQDSKSPYDGYRKDKNGNYIRVDGRGGDTIDYLYDEQGNIIASTPVSFTEIEVGPYRRTYGQGTKYVSPALYDPSFDIFAWWASGEVLGAALVKTYRYLSGVGRVAKLETKLARTPVGKSKNILNVVTKNSPTTINGTKFTGHALDQMQARGIISPRAVFDVIKNPARTFPGNKPGTSVFIRDNLKVITNKVGDIITVIPQ